MNQPTATGTTSHEQGFNLRERIERAKERIGQLVQPPKPPSPCLPVPVTARTWERKPEICQFCGNPMSKRLFGDGYFCSPCDANANQATLRRLETGKIHALFPQVGTISNLSRRAFLSPGQFAASVREAMQDEARKKILSELSTHKNLTKTIEISELQTIKPLLPQPTIGRVDTPPLLPPPAPNTPMPATCEPRECLFADVTANDYTWQNEDDDDRTQRRPAVVPAPSTSPLPPLELLEYLAQGISEQNTGENERLPVKQDGAFLL